MKTEPFVIERTYDANAARVWAAITDIDQMRQWYFDMDDFKPEPGFKFRFEGGPPETVYVHFCEVKEVVEMEKLSYSWTYEGYPGHSVVTFELFPEGDRTRV